MLAITSHYAVASLDERSHPIGVSLFREDGVRLVGDMTVAEALDLAQALVASATAQMVVAAAPPKPVHTVRGKPIGPEGVPYGTTHDYECPACQGTSFTASPRSETYWSS